MLVIKLYRKPDEPEFYRYVRSGKRGILVNYPISKPDSHRLARWFEYDEVYIDWIREFV